MLDPTAAQPALVVVDVQNGFVNDRSRHVIPVIKSLVRKWSEEGRPVFFTRFLNLPGSKWESLIGWERLREAPETDIVDELQQVSRDHVIVDKPNLYDSVTGALRTALDNESVADVLICGIATESCVLATALGVFEHPNPKATPWIIADASASHAGAAAHASGLVVAERFIGRSQLISADSAKTFTGSE